jgi:hypothetical protein
MAWSRLVRDSPVECWDGKRSRGQIVHNVQVGTGQLIQVFRYISHCPSERAIHSIEGVFIDIPFTASSDISGRDVTDFDCRVLTTSIRGHVIIVSITLPARYSTWRLAASHSFFRLAACLPLTAAVSLQIFVALQAALICCTTDSREGAASFFASGQS